MYVFTWNILFVFCCFLRRKKKKRKEAPHFDLISYKALVTQAVTVSCVVRTVRLVCGSEFGEGTWWWCTFTFCLQSTCSARSVLSAVTSSV